MRALTRRVPGGAGRQLALFNERNIRPAFERQMIKQPHAHDATTNNYDPRMRFHVKTPFRPCFAVFGRADKGSIRAKPVNQINYLR
jgi:hypothetical protein